MPSRLLTAAVNDQTPAEQPTQNEELSDTPSTEQPAETASPIASQESATTTDAPASEEQAAQEKHPAKDYSQLSPDELIAELDTLLKEQPIQHIGRQARSIHEAFEAQVASLAKTAKESQGEESPAAGRAFPSGTSLDPGSGSISMHSGQTTAKNANSIAAQMAVEQKANLEERLALIEELKNLIEKEENASIREFHNIQARWRKCGMGAPRTILCRMADLPTPCGALFRLLETQPANSATWNSSATWPRRTRSSPARKS